MADAGLVLDLSGLDAIDVDVDGRSAWAQGGATAGAYTTAVARHGLATGFGDTPGVGAAGLTLGGGIGWLVRKHGLTIDSVLEAELVTAAGDVLQVDRERHPELFWALRGGGGDFGVVTRLRYRLHAVDRILGGMLIFPASPEALAGLVAAAAEAPDELSMILHTAKAPPAPFIPAEHHGRPVILAVAVYAGDPGDGARVIDTIRRVGAPLVDGVRPMRYPEIFELGGGGPERAAMATRNGYADAFDQDAAGIALEHVRSARTAMAVTQIRVLGGAVARVPEDATAYAHRDRRMLVITAAVSSDPAAIAEADAWADGAANALGLLDGGAYVNYVSDDTETTVRRAYPGGTLERLREVKRAYDPTNLFRLNRNVGP